MNKPKIAVVIINWNGIVLLEECLCSVENQIYGNSKIIFVDNGSSDGSAGFVRGRFPKVDIIQLDKNTGFAKANNVGIHRALEDKEVEYVALLNNDAVAEKSWLGKMLEVAEQNDRIGSVAPKILKYYHKNEFDCFGIKIRIIGSGMNNLLNMKDDGSYDRSYEVFGTSGCSCLYKRKMLEDIVIEDEYFDNDFFAYCEDIDLDWRMRLRGWKSFTAPGSVVFHKGSATCQTYSYFKAFHSHRNRLFVMLKNYPLFFLARGMAVFIFSYLHYFKSIFRNKGYSARTKEKIGYLNTAKFIILGWSSYFSHFFKMLKKRRIIQKMRIASDRDVSEWFTLLGEADNVSEAE
ncbi:MAG: glycosyltransferase family 2 protein [Candidatus Paceibacterota bacterium]|jgi:hypothetical protein